MQMFITLNISRNIFYKKRAYYDAYNNTAGKSTFFPSHITQFASFQSRRLHFLFAIKFGNTLYIFEGIVAYRSTNRDVISHNTDCACNHELQPVVILPD